MLCLIARIGSERAALPLECVVETMRPQPIRQWAGPAIFIRGIARIRGAAAPVLDGRVLLGMETSGDEVRRFVSVRVGLRTVALAVDSVDGIRSIEAQQLQQLPPLLARTPQSIVSAVATLDDDLVGVLSLSRLVSEDVWQTLDAESQS